MSAPRPMPMWHKYTHFHIGGLKGRILFWCYILFHKLMKSKIKFFQNIKKTYAMWEGRIWSQIQKLGCWCVVVHRQNARSVGLPGLVRRLRRLGTGCWGWGWYKVLGTTQGVIEETIHQRQALNWNLDFGYNYGTFCPHRVAEITAHRHSWSCRSVKDDKISVQLWTCHLTSPRPFSKVISRQWIDRKSQMALKVNLCGQHLTKSHWDNLVH